MRLTLEHKIRKNEEFESLWKLRGVELWISIAPTHLLMTLVREFRNESAVNFREKACRRSSYFQPVSQPVKIRSSYRADSPLTLIKRESSRRSGEIPCILSGKKKEVQSSGEIPEE